MKFFKKNIQFIFLICLFVTVIAIDVTGYMLIEKVDLTDALHMTVISITTVGFGEVFELSQAGRIFTYFVLFSGLGVFLRVLFNW